jgi:hypothetical protein
MKINDLPGAYPPNRQSRVKTTTGGTQIDLLFDVTGGAVYLFELN